MIDTIEVSLPGEYVWKVGGNQAFADMLAAANLQSSEQGKQLASQNFKDVTVRLDKDIDIYFAVFSLR